MFEDGKKDKKFLEILEKKLISGDFQLLPYVLNKEDAIKKSNMEGNVHHDQIAKDDKSMGKNIKSKNGKKSINTFDAARNLAQRQTNKIVKKKLKN